MNMRMKIVALVLALLSPFAFTAPAQAAPTCATVYEYNKVVDGMTQHRVLNIFDGYAGKLVDIWTLVPSQFQKWHYNRCDGSAFFITYRKSIPDYGYLVINKGVISDPA